MYSPLSKLANSLVCFNTSSLDNKVAHTNDYNFKRSSNNQYIYMNRQCWSKFRWKIFKFRFLRLCQHGTCFAITTTVQKGHGDKPMPPTVLQSMAPTVLQSMAPTVLQSVAPTVLQSVAPTVLQSMAQTVLQSIAPAVLQSVAPMVLQSMES